MPVVIIHPRVAAHLGRSRPLGVVAAGRRPWSRAARGGSGEFARLVDDIAASPVSALVLARTDDHRLRDAARFVGRDVLTIADDLDAVAWAAAVLATRDAATRSDRVADVVVAAAGARGSDPAQARPAVRFPALRPAALERWAAIVWTACAHCRRGGIGGLTCPSCGVAIAGKS